MSEDTDINVKGLPLAKGGIAWTQKNIYIYIYQPHQIYQIPWAHNDNLNINFKRNALITFRGCYARETTNYSDNSKTEEESIYSFSLWTVLSGNKLNYTGRSFLKIIPVNKCINDENYIIIIFYDP